MIGPATARLDTFTDAAFAFAASLTSITTRRWNGCVFSILS